MKRKCELLAPAGGMEQLIAAVENGADAVYLGGSRFNARMNAANFSDEDMLSAISYAHLRGVSIYVTVNILISDSEMPAALAYAASLYEMGADALIIQDLGLARLVHEYMPDFHLHLSTQGTVYNLSGARAAGRLGFSRVVPARELSLDEIKQLAEANVCDIEVFAHGALCICYSGQCQMSRAIGGRSGNRGECAQPCRLPYSDDAGREGYWLSPKDLCTVDILPQLLAAGVSSLKIEGRMKSPEYVAVVTRIYRKYLDMAEAGREHAENKSRLDRRSGLMRKEAGCEYAVAESDREELMQIFNRGGFTAGYLHGNPGDDLLSGELPKHQGVYIGKVVGRASWELVDIAVEKPLHYGDGIEMHEKNGASGRPLTGNVVTYIEELDSGILRVGDIKGPVEKGEPVFRITDKELMKKAAGTFADSSARTGAMRRTNADMIFTVMEGQTPELHVRSGKHQVHVCGSRKAERAEKKPLDEESICGQLRKTGGTPFSISGIRVITDGGSFLPLADINKLRRQALSALSAEITAGRAAPAVPIQKIREESKQAAAAERQISASAAEALAGAAQFNIMTEGEIGSGIYHLPAITRGGCDSYIEENLDSLPDKIVVENLGWISELAARGKQVFAGSGLNVFNLWSRKAIEDLGAVCIAMSEECQEQPDVLMVTEHPFRTQWLQDRSGKRYCITANRYGDKYTITDERMINRQTNNWKEDKKGK